jgi:hypothetical protein
MNLNGYDVTHLKEVMDREKLTWRSFVDPGPVGQGAITISWNVTSIPTLYVIDHKGVIRHKWVGGLAEKTIDVAVDRLIEEAELAKTR